MIWYNGMAKFVGSSRLREGGRPVVHYQDFIAHTGATDWRHDATNIDMMPTLPAFNGITVQTAIENLYGLVTSDGTGYISVGNVDGYGIPGKYNVNSISTPTFEAAMAAAIADPRIAAGGTILILPGIYRVSTTISIPEGVSILGESGTYIVGQTSGGNPIFNIERVSSTFSINGDAGFGDQDVVLGTTINQTVFENLIITDNSDGYVSSGAPTLSGSTDSMIFVERGANVSFNKVSFIGRLADGSVLNRLKTSSAIRCNAIGAVAGTSISINKCYFDAFRTPIWFNPEIGSSDHLSVKNCKIRFYGVEDATYTSGTDTCISSSLSTLEIESNYIVGEGAFAQTILDITSASVPNTNCSIKVKGNSGYTNSSTSEVCIYNNASSVRSAMSGNTWSPSRYGSDSWTVVIDQNEGDFVGSNGLDLFLSTYSSSSSSNPATVILNPGVYNLTVASGSLYNIKLQGNQVGKQYPIIKLNLSAGSNNDYNNLYVAFNNSIKNIFFAPDYLSSNYSSVHVTSSNTIAETVAENIIVDNCIFQDVQLYVDVNSSDSTTNAGGAQAVPPLSGLDTRMQAIVSSCRFYQSSSFQENWSLYLPNIDNVKLVNSLFHGKGYALAYGSSPSSPTSGTSNSNFIIDSCTFDLSNIIVASPPSAGNPYYIDISSTGTTSKIINTVVLSSANGASAPFAFSASKFLIRTLVRDLHISDSYFNTPKDVYTDSGNYPVVGLYVQWCDSVNITNNVFNSGGLPLKIQRANIGTASADQYYCNISNNRITQLSDFLTLLDFECNIDGTDSQTRKVFIDSNLFFNNQNVTSSEYPEHFDVTGADYDVGAAVQIYALGASVNFTNNDVLISAMREPGSSPFTHIAGVYCNTYSSGFGRTSHANVSGNHIDVVGTNVTPASSSNYCSSLHIKSNHIRVNNNRINFTGNGTATAGFKGCLVLDGSADGGSGSGIVSNNIFDRSTSTGSFTTLYRGCILIDCNYKGQITDNNFISPYISGTNTTLVEDNTPSIGTKWLYTRNVHQTQTTRAFGCNGQLGFKQSTDSYYSSAGDPSGGSYSSEMLYINSDSSYNVVFIYRDSGDLMQSLWSIPLKTVVPEGASILEISTTFEISAGFTTTATCSLSLITPGVAPVLGDTWKIGSFSNPTPTPITLTVSQSYGEFIVQGDNPAYIEAGININNIANLEGYIYPITITYRF